MNHIHDLMDDERCYETIRQKRWPHAIHCPRCTSNKIVEIVKNHRHSACWRYPAETAASNGGMVAPGHIQMPPASEKEKPPIFGMIQRGGAGGDSYAGGR